MSRLFFNPFTGTFDWVSRPGEGLVVGEIPSGDIDGSNKIFTTAHKFAESSMRVHFNGQRLTEGTTEDYTLSESGGSGSGFDTITLALAPVSPDVVLVDYARK